MLITSFHDISTNSSRELNVHPDSSLAKIILSIGQSQIHLIAFNQNLIFLSSIYVNCFNESFTLGGKTDIHLDSHSHTSNTILSIFSESDTIKLVKNSVG
ncbi:MAG: hypothetical protein Q8S84_06545 [bacterium]|nr:hypothetical protein [bacterium]MDP3381124.1 hypothetical protein [bacterium]